MRFKTILYALLSVAIATASFAATNSMTIALNSGSASDYPVQFGRPFAQGEIAQYPQAVVDGTPVTTQADVKTRWGDGSVKHAIISFVLSSISTTSKAITFQNQATGNNTGYLDKAGMMGAGYDFDATMALTSGTTQTASARTMLNADTFTYWLQGSVCTSVIIADHSVARAYDLGWDANKTFRPIFLATFWPTINKVRVRYIGEISNTEAVQDMTYSLALTRGSAAPSTWYTKSSFTHYGGSRWTKETWIGTAPTARSINHNLAYLKTTKLVSNYDTSLMPSESKLASEYGVWTSANKDLFDAGNLEKAMGNGGGRRDIGPNPAWTTRWLYTGDYRMEEMALGNADLAAAWDLHFREGDATKKMDRAGSFDGLGKAVSISSRPTLFLQSHNAFIGNGNADDKINVTGSMSAYANGWDTNVEHVPDYYFIPYLLTGDYWYLEQLYFWGAWGAASGGDPSTATADYGRGPTGAYGCIWTTPWREVAWIFRSWVNAAAAAPDTTAEKSYFTQLIADYAAALEGRFNITDGYYYNNASWQFGYNYYGGAQSQAIGYLGQGSAYAAGDSNGQINLSVTSTANSMWQHNYVIWSFGRAYELGFNTKKVLDALSTMYIGFIISSGTPKAIGSYRVPVYKASTGNYFTTWPDLMSGFNSIDWDTDWETGLPGRAGDAQHGYCYIAYAAGAMLYDTPSAAAAWTWIKGQAEGNSILNDDPTWAITQRDATAAQSRRATGGGTIAGSIH